MATRKRFFQLSVLLLLAIMAFILWRVFGSDTNFKEDKRPVYIKTGSDFERVRSQLLNGGIIKHARTFNMIAKFLNYKDDIKPGKYVIEKGSSIYAIIKLLRSGEQTPVTLVLDRMHTRDELVKKLGDNFECRSSLISNFINSNDSLAAYGVDTNTVMTVVIPASYKILWNAPFPVIFKTLYDAKQKFWTADRKQKAADLGLTPDQVYTLASIVQEETWVDADKGKIASVYLNRLTAGMFLGADPTIKFALKDFGLKRIYEKHLGVISPYNTYKNKGLPPGPICAATEKSIDAVLNAPATNYFYFVAKPELNGYSNFAETYPEHLRYAKAYQDSQDSIQRRKAEGREKVIE